MITIAICDNDLTDLTLTKQAVEQYLTSHAFVDIKIVVREDGRRLLEMVQAGQHYDIFILDILMPDVSGIALGKAIRALQKDAQIIYTSSSKEYALEAYGVHALQYLVKPVTNAALFQALEEAILRCSQTEKEIYNIKCKDGSMHSVVLSSISYIENRFRSPVYHLNDQSEIVGISIRRTFEDAVGSITTAKSFLHPHKSFFVNMQYIRTLTADEIILDDGTKIPISQKNGALSKRRYLDYLSEIETAYYRKDE